MNRRVLIAGVGNVFFGDDGFGVEVVRRLSAEPLPEGVRALDFGIRGVHLAFELLEPVDLLVLVDAISRNERPGTLYLIEPDGASLSGPGCDAHALDPFAVLSTVQSMGGTLPKTRIVGCEPEDISQGMRLSRTVQSAVGPAISMIHRVLGEEASC